MKISVLVENTAVRSGIKAEHGLSFFLETGGKVILVDTGQRELFAENAAAMGCDLSKVDFAVLSHGHGDHSGGLPAFRALNPKAPVYTESTAGKRLYVRVFGIFFKNVGMPRNFAHDPGIVPLSADVSPAEGVTIVTGISRPRPYLSTSRNLYMRKGLGFARDDFSHEIVLVVQEGARTFIFSSCSHSGLHNIMETLKERNLLSGENIVFAGMHLFDPVGRRTESPAILERFADELASFPDTTYYSGHCTGTEAFDFLRLRLGDRVKSFGCGEVFEF